MRIFNVGDPVVLNVTFKRDGVLYDPVDIQWVKIYYGGTLLSTLAPTKISTGNYRVTYTTSLTDSTGEYSDVWRWKGSSLLAYTQYRYHFYLVSENHTLPDPDPSVVGRYGQEPTTGVVGRAGRGKPTVTK